MLASVRKCMPTVNVHQLTDEHCAGLDGVDNVIRMKGNMPMAVQRMRHHASCIGEWLFIDADIIITKDVSDVFDEPFDIAVTDRVGTDMEGTKYGLAMPYNMGVTFSRSPAFWISVCNVLAKMPPKLQEWCGDQMAVCELVKTWPNVKILPGAKYNYPPLSADDNKTQEASILHYKGNRKQLLMEVA